MDDGSLTAGFAPADGDVWRGLVEKTLGGSSFEKRLVSRTYDGIEIQPLYTAGDGVGSLAAPLRERSGLSPDQPWDIRASVDHPDIANANKLALAELEGGASSLLIRLDPEASQGVVVTSKGGLERLLDGVLFDLAPVALEAGFAGPMAGEWLAQIANAKTLKPHILLHLDPLNALASSGRSPGPLQTHLEAAAKAASNLQVESAFLACGRAVHEAGGSDAQEIGFMAAAGLAYVKAMADAGLALEAALDRITLGVSADGDYFSTIAKVRAARAVWAALAKALCPNGLSPTAARPPVEVRSSRRMLSVLDPWVNMLRLTSAAVGASLGGADSILLDPFTQPLGPPTVFARRQARNIQLVLMNEAHLGLVADPAGGAWFLERFTDRLAAASWGVFQIIEGAGGAAQALTSGLVAREVAKVRERRRADIARRKVGIVGVSEFANLEGATAEIDQEAANLVREPLRLDPPPGPDASAPALTPWRASEGFETLRAAAARIAPAPRAYLASIGAQKDFAARVSFARNVLAAGGLGSDLGPWEDYAAASGPLVVLCGSDEGYAQSAAAAAAAALKRQGAGKIVLAGRPGEGETGLRTAGVDDFLFAGCDIEGVLATLIALFAGGAGS